MKPVHLMTVALVLAVVPAASAADKESLRSIYGVACSSNNIDDQQCFCILDEVLKKHGEAATRFVGLDMSLRYDESMALLEQIGEDAGYAASLTFEDAQYKECSAGRLARLEGTFQSAGPADVSTTMTTSEDAAGGTVSTGQRFATFDAFPSAVPILDLRHLDGEAIADVTLEIKEEILKGNPNANFQDHITFFPVVNLNAEIDTDGDGEPDLRPGDPDYAVEAQKRSLTKLYISRDGGTSQVLGELRFRRGLYAPYVRIDLPGNGGGMGGFNPADLNNMENLMRAMKTPQKLFFGDPGANPNGGNHLAKRDNNSIGFSRSPDGNSHDDAIFKLRIGM